MALRNVQMTDSGHVRLNGLMTQALLGQGSSEMTQGILAMDGISVFNRYNRYFRYNRYGITIYGHLGIPLTRIKTGRITRDRSPHACVTKKQVDYRC